MIKPVCEYLTRANGESTETMSDRAFMAAAVDARDDGNLSDAPTEWDGDGWADLRVGRTMVRRCSAGFAGVDWPHRGVTRGRARSLPRGA